MTQRVTPSKVPTSTAANDNKRSSIPCLRAGRDSTRNLTDYHNRCEPRRRPLDYTDNMTSEPSSTRWSLGPDPGRLCAWRDGLGSQTIDQTIALCSETTYCQPGLPPNTKLTGISGKHEQHNALNSAWRQAATSSFSTPGTKHTLARQQHRNRADRRLRRPDCRHTAPMPWHRSTASDPEAAPGARASC